MRHGIIHRRHHHLRILIIHLLHLFPIVWLLQLILLIVGLLILIWVSVLRIATINWDAPFHLGIPTSQWIGIRISGKGLLIKVVYLWRRHLLISQRWRCHSLRCHHRLLAHHLLIRRYHLPHGWSLHHRNSHSRLLSSRYLWRHSLLHRIWRPHLIHHTHLRSLLLIAHHARIVWSLLHLIQHAGIGRGLLILSHHLRVELIVFRHHHHLLRAGTVKVSHQQICLHLSLSCGNFRLRWRACDDGLGWAFGVGKRFVGRFPAASLWFLLAGLMQGFSGWILLDRFLLGVLRLLVLMFS